MNETTSKTRRWDIILKCIGWNVGDWIHLAEGWGQLVCCCEHDSKRWDCFRFEHCNLDVL